MTRSDEPFDPKAHWERIVQRQALNHDKHMRAIRDASVTPMRQRRRDDDLDCNVSRVLGYRGVHGEHWKGPMRATAAAAREDVRQHRETCRGSIS